MAAYRVRSVYICNTDASVAAYRVTYMLHGRICRCLPCDVYVTPPALYARPVVWARRARIKERLQPEGHESAAQLGPCRTGGEGTQEREGLLPHGLRSAGHSLRY